MVVSYETTTYRRRFIYDEGRLADGRSFLKEGERGEIYCGKVLEKIENLGYLIDLGPFKGLCQEKIHPGEIRLFEIIKKQEDKYPLVTLRVGLIGESLILKSGGEAAFSKAIPPAYRQVLEALDLKGVFFRREALKKPLRLVREEFEALKKKKEDMEKERRPGLVHRPPFSEEGDPFAFLELEERILHLRRGVLEERGLCLYFEPTRAGLVIDVNGLGTEEEINKKAVKHIEESLLLMNVGGLVLVDFVGSGKGYKGPGSLTPEGVLVRSLPVRGANMFNASLENLEEDYKKLRQRLSEDEQ